MKRYVQRAIKRHGEVDSHVFDINVTPNTVSVVTGPMMAVPDAKRTGLQLAVNSLRIKGHILASGTRGRVRVLWFRWKETSTPGPTDVLAPVTGSNISVDSEYVFDKLARSKFAVISDKVYLVSTSHGAPEERTIKHYLKTPKKMIFTSTTSTSAKNHIYVLTASSSAGAPHPVYTVSALTRFTQDGGIG
ncbi:MAG TPA: hypothetical protein EYO33_31125 [Phycisphaerales bacterium]|nr:hypothetical protein [Phycisphaerales bacterium]